MGEILRVIDPELIVEPEPLLVKFLGKYALNIAEIVGDEIQVQGVSPQNEDFKLVRRCVTADEVDQAERWMRETSKGSKSNTPIVHLNMKLLQGLRAKMPLPPKPLL